MFEARRAKKAAREYEEALAGWEEQRAGYAQLLELAENFSGSPSAEMMLAAGEGVFFTVTGVGLIEERRGQGHYAGRSAGVSVPIGSIAGHPIRYRVGASRGHFEQGAPTMTAVDQGTVFVTNKRVVFAGAKQTRECLFSKLIAFEHDDVEGSTTFSVSNRQKPTTVHYGRALSAAFDFRLDLALAHFRGSTAELVSQLQADLAQLDAQRPVAPAGPSR